MLLRPWPHDAVKGKMALFNEQCGQRPRCVHACLHAKRAPADQEKGQKGQLERPDHTFMRGHIDVLDPHAALPLWLRAHPQQRGVGAERRSKAEQSWEKGNGCVKRKMQGKFYFTAHPRHNLQKTRTVPNVRALSTFASHEETGRFGSRV